MTAGRGETHRRRAILPGEMPPDNLEIVRRVYALWDPGARGDRGEYLDPDIEWSTPHPDAGSLRGREAVVGWLRAYPETLSELRHDVDELRELDDGRVLALFTETSRGRHSGIEVRVDGGALWTLRDGLVVRFHAYGDRRDALREAGLGD